jgi:alkylhydroperoxidase/carboxymuconolactone decarboxylase family protein YurZ
LSARDRELVAVAVLAATGWRRQLVSHLLGAARLGAAPLGLRRALAAGLRVAEGSARVTAATAWREAFGGREPRAVGP